MKTVCVSQCVPVCELECVAWNSPGSHETGTLRSSNMAAGERINKSAESWTQSRSDNIRAKTHTQYISVCVLKGPLVTVTILFQRLVWKSSAHSFRHFAVLLLLSWTLKMFGLGTNSHDCSSACQHSGFKQSTFSALIRWAEQKYFSNCWGITELYMLQRVLGVLCMTYLGSHKYSAQRAQSFTAVHIHILDA